MEQKNVLVSMVIYAAIMRKVIFFSERHTGITRVDPSMVIFKLFSGWAEAGHELS
jgi:hypothetical protein